MKSGQINFSSKRVVVVLASFVMTNCFNIIPVFPIRGRMVSSKLTMSMHSSEHLYSFDSLKQLDERCGRLTSLESEFMLSFWSESLQCFQIYPNMATERVSATTTWYGMI